MGRDKMVFLNLNLKRFVFPARTNYHSMAQLYDLTYANEFREYGL